MGQAFSSAPRLNFQWERQQIQLEIEGNLKLQKEKKSTYKQFQTILLKPEAKQMVKTLFDVATLVEEQRRSSSSDKSRGPLARHNSSVSHLSSEEVVDETKTNANNVQTTQSHLRTLDRQPSTPTLSAPPAMTLVPSITPPPSPPSTRTAPSTPQSHTTPKAITNLKMPEHTFLLIFKRLNWRIKEVVGITNFFGDSTDPVKFRRALIRDIYIRCILPTNKRQREIWWTEDSLHDENQLLRGLPSPGDNLVEFKLELNESQFTDFLVQSLLALCLDLNPTSVSQRNLMDNKCTLL